MDDNEMAVVYDKYKNTVYRAAFSICRNTADAEDITHDVFLKRFGYTKSFADENHEKAWLLRVTVNRCRDLLKSFRYKYTVPLEEESVVYETTEESAVYNAVMELPPKYRIAVHLCYYEGYSVKEISGIVKKSETAVQTQLYRARKMLKTKLGEELDL